MSALETAIARLVWSTRYRAAGDGDFAATCRRVAQALAGPEAGERTPWEARFFELLSHGRFLPGGRILAGAGVDRQVTLFNCFVMGTLPDDMGGIFDGLKEGALTMQQGGGVGYDFSTLRPAGVACRRVGGIASGPVSFMRVWDAMCSTLLSTASRRGAMMATLRCDHPDVEAFVEAKRDPRELRNFNLSVLASDAFMAAVSAGEDWPLVFPVDQLGDADRARYPETVRRRWSGDGAVRECAVIRRVPARALWDRIMAANYDTAEPGVLFSDRLNRENSLGYREWISATNPCGEIPLPPYGACNLGSMNLTAYVREPFSAGAGLDLEALAADAGVAARLLDNVIDVSGFPLPRQAAQARGSRRVGLGITGLADALIMLGLHYGSDGGRAVAARAMETVRDAAWWASVELARERGPFPFFDAAGYLARPYVRALPEGLREAVVSHGVRNSHLTAIAPAGTISLLADSVSSGIEPVFQFSHRRRVRDADGALRWHTVEDYAYRHWRRLRGDDPLPEAFVAAGDLSPAEHLAMQAAVQPFVDNAVSKTVNVPERMDFEAFKGVYAEAYRLGLKGCTTFRPNPVTGAVLEADEPPAPPEEGSHCCGLEREGD